MAAWATRLPEDGRARSIAFATLIEGILEHESVVLIDSDEQVALSLQEANENKTMPGEERRPAKRSN